MTAEIAVMNRLAIALASDSAATSVHGVVPKIFNADKLFNLADCAPVAAMFYQGSSFLSIPWDTVVKQFRSTISGELPWLKDYANKFQAFLTSDDLISEEFVDANFWWACSAAIRDLLQRARRRRREKKGKLSENFKVLATAYFDFLSKQPFLSPMGEDTIAALRERYSDKLPGFVKETISALDSVDGELNELICEVLLLFTTKDVQHDCTGVIIGGYGSKEMFPGLIELRVEGVVHPRILRVRKIRELGISLDSRAQIVPFAQAEMVYTFMQGVDPTFRSNALSALEELLDRIGTFAVSNCPQSVSASEKDAFSKAINDTIQAALEGLDEEFDAYSRKYHAQAVLDAVALLPKDQLALMAETLVSLTSFRRRMSSDLESVGGPVDVAVISKGDGFVWTKRKHYFDAGLNPRYFRWIQSRLPPPRIS